MMISIIKQNLKLTYGKRLGEPNQYVIFVYEIGFDGQEHLKSEAHIDSKELEDLLKAMTSLDE